MPRLHGIFPREVVPPRSTFSVPGRFGRMFGDLPAFASDTAATRAALMEIGKPGGIMDAKDRLDVGPIRLVTDAEFSDNNRNNPNMTAGVTFLGQFLDHDMTFDPTSTLERQVDPESIANFRTPTLALDHLYGIGPGGSPHIYDQSADGRGIKFLIEETGTPGKHDLPRNSQMVALIADPRNDENLILSQLHLAFLKFHNKVVDFVEDESESNEPDRVFAEAQRIVRWHYQWIIVHEFLDKLCGTAVVQDILKNGRKHYRFSGEPYMPVEFSVAAFRMGHSQVRPSYRANFTGNNGAPFFAMIFTPTPSSPTDPDDLSGGVRAPRRFIDWPTFFDFGDGQFRPNKTLDITLSTALFALPKSTIGDLGESPRSLAQRNLLRHLTFSLPSGQRIARAMRLPVLDRLQLAMLKPHRMDVSTPLWFYILLEAQEMEKGQRLGPMGARLVAEVMLGLIAGDRTSYLAQEEEWRPHLPTIDAARQGKDFKMVDLLRFAGVA